MKPIATTSRDVSTSSVSTTAQLSTTRQAGESYQSCSVSVRDLFNDGSFSTFLSSLTPPRYVPHSFWPRQRQGALLIRCLAAAACSPLFFPCSRPRIAAPSAQLNGMYVSQTPPPTSRDPSQRHSQGHAPLVPVTTTMSHNLPRCSYDPGMYTPTHLIYMHCDHCPCNLPHRLLATYTYQGSRPRAPMTAEPQSRCTRHAHASRPRHGVPYPDAALQQL